MRKISRKSRVYFKKINEGFKDKDKLRRHATKDVKRNILARI